LRRGDGILAVAAYGNIQGAIPAKAADARTIAVATTTTHMLRNLCMSLPPLAMLARAHLIALEQVKEWPLA
jgi:hypothetical protein